MKNFITVIVIFIILIGGCFFNMNYLKSLRSDMENDLLLLQAAVDGSYAEAEKYIHSIERTLKDNKTILAVLINHNLIENIELSLKNIGELYTLKDTLHLKLHLCEMEFYICQITDEHALTLENLL